MARRSRKSKAALELVAHTRCAALTGHQNRDQVREIVWKTTLLDDPAHRPITGSKLWRTAARAFVIGCLDCGKHFETTYESTPPECLFQPEHEWRQTFENPIRVAYLCQACGIKRQEQDISSQKRAARH